jgi:hypothetical protein
MTKKFIPPTPQEVTEYAASIGFKIDGDYFCNSYQAKGWIYSGTTPLRDWRAAVRTWKIRNKYYPGPVQKPAVVKFAEQRRRQLIEQKQITEYAGRIQAIRAWRGNANCPFGNPIDVELRMRTKIKDNFGDAFLAQVLTKCKDIPQC